MQTWAVIDRRHSFNNEGREVRAGEVVPGQREPATAS
jgi:hypothetical protein